MLVTLADMKAYLGIVGNTYDAFLTQQIVLISDVIENYTNRKFLEATYIQTFYNGDYEPSRNITLYHYPVSDIESIDEDDMVITDTYRYHKPTGIITRTCGRFFYNASPTAIEYTAGYPYASLPPAIQEVVYGLVQERYNRKVSGVSLDFGSDVQRVSIPGTISIDFDYTLTSNERSSSFGKILGTWANVLDPYRSERALIGSDSIEYVEVAP